MWHASRKPRQSAQQRRRTHGTRPGHDRPDGADGRAGGQTAARDDRHRGPRPHRGAVRYVRSRPRRCSSRRPRHPCGPRHHSRPPPGARGHPTGRGRLLPRGRVGHWGAAGVRDAVPQTGCRQRLRRGLGRLPNGPRAPVPRGGAGRLDGAAVDRREPRSARGGAGALGRHGRQFRREPRRRRRAAGQGRRWPLSRDAGAGVPGNRQQREHRDLHRPGQPAAAQSGLDDLVLRPLRPRCDHPWQRRPLPGPCERPLRPAPCSGAHRGARRAPPGGRGLRRCAAGGRQRGHPPAVRRPDARLLHPAQRAARQRRGTRRRRRCAGPTEHHPDHTRQNARELEENLA